MLGVLLVTVLEYDMVVVALLHPLVGLFQLWWVMLWALVSCLNGRFFLLSYCFVLVRFLTFPSITIYPVPPSIIP